MTASQAVDLVYKVLGESASGADRMAYGHKSITYDVPLADRNVIVRMNDSAQVFACTQTNIVELKKLGMPVPNILAFDLTLTKFPFAYMILDKIPGTDLGHELSSMSAAQMTRLAEQIVGFQRLVGSLPEGTGYGYAGIGERADQESWWDLIRPRVKGDEDALDMLLSEQMSEHESYFRAIPPTCFLDDVTVKNVIVKEGELQGIVDLDFVCYGDPLLWLALTATGVVSDVGAAGAFYVEELKRLWGLTEEQKRILRLYTASTALDFLHMYAKKEADDWITRMKRSVESLLRSS